MPVTKLFNEPHVLWQTADGDHELPEPAIAVHVDNAGVLVLEQEGRPITVTWASLPELIGQLKDLAKRRPR